MTMLGRVRKDRALLVFVELEGEKPVEERQRTQTFTDRVLIEQIFAGRRSHHLAPEYNHFFRFQHPQCKIARGEGGIAVGSFLYALRFCLMSVDNDTVEC